MAFKHNAINADKIQITSGLSKSKIEAFIVKFAREDCKATSRSGTSAVSTVC